MDYVGKALNIAELLKLPPLIATALYRMSQIYFQQNDSENAQYYGSKALNLYNDIKSKLNDEDQQFYNQKPEYATLLEV